MSQPAPKRSVFIVGGGPAGLSAAIAARQAGLSVSVADSRRPPIDKACGEGLMPAAVAALQKLGIHFSPDESVPFRGVRFVDGQSGLSTEAVFSQGRGLAVRRTTLHRKLAERASEAGAAIFWGAHVSLLKNGQTVCEGCETEGAWIIGADGLQSSVRRWAGLQPARRETQRFGFRRHYRVRPWTDFVEVYWGPTCQIAVTPTAADEAGLAMISRNPEQRLDAALLEMPALALRIIRAEAVGKEIGALCVLRRWPAVTRRHVALIGDASGSVDPVTGEGLGLAFQQALALAAALRRNSLAGYGSAHREIGRLAHRMSQLILLMDGSPWLRQRALRALAAEPRLFSRLLNAQAEGPSGSCSWLTNTLKLGWRVARA
jgi:flavin-dependent dehydrogenase